jgi:anti-sigma factor RsiW
MRSFLDGEVADRTRREVGRHLAACEDCARLIEDDRFWNETIRGYLDHELPDGLRESILGDLAPGQTAGLNDLDWRKQVRIAWWAVRRDLSRPRELIRTVAVAAVLVLMIVYLPVWLAGKHTTPDKEAFGRSGPIVQMGETADWKPGETVPTARLSLSGRLI